MPSFQPTSAPTASIDYSCIHYQSWLLNVDNGNDYDPVFSTYTDIVSSYGTAGTTNAWIVSSNQIPYYNHTLLATDLLTLNGRPLASIDFINSGGQSIAVVGNKYSFGRNIGYVSEACSLGYWPQGTAVCPHSVSKTITFPLKPAPEISFGKYHS
jgi:hypothetical protein